MNETTHIDGASDVPVPISHHPVRLPETPMSPGSEKSAPAVVGALNSAVLGAHDTIDRIADSVAPAARQLDERVSKVGDAIDAKTVQMRDTRDEWAESLRTTVRDNPLASIAAAVALGAVIARLTR